MLVGVVVIVLGGGVAAELRQIIVRCMQELSTDEQWPG